MSEVGCWSTWIRQSTWLIATKRPYWSINRPSGGTTAKIGKGPVGARFPTMQLRLMKEIIPDILDEALQLAIHRGDIAVNVIMVHQWHPAVMRRQWHPAVVRRQWHPAVLRCLSTARSHYYHCPHPTEVTSSLLLLSPSYGDYIITITSAPILWRLHHHYYHCKLFWTMLYNWQFTEQT